MAPSDAPSPYQVLGVDPAATAAEVRRAHRRLVRRHHPDVGGERAEFERVQQAWSVLGEPEARDRYDASLGDNALRTRWARVAEQAAAEHYLPGPVEGRTAERWLRLRATPAHRPPPTGWPLRLAPAALVLLGTAPVLPLLLSGGPTWWPVPVVGAPVGLALLAGLRRRFRPVSTAETVVLLLAATAVVPASVLLTRLLPAALTAGLGGTLLLAGALHLVRLRRRRRPVTAAEWVSPRWWAHVTGLTSRRGLRPRRG